jgi:hypothetical protein
MNIFMAKDLGVLQNNFRRVYQTLLLCYPLPDFSDHRSTALSLPRSALSSRSEWLLTRRYPSSPLRGRPGIAVPVGLSFLFLRNWSLVRGLKCSFRYSVRFNMAEHICSEPVQVNGVIKAYGEVWFLSSFLLNRKSIM